MYRITLIAVNWSRSLPTIKDGWWNKYWISDSYLTGMRGCGACKTCVVTPDIRWSLYSVVLGWVVNMSIYLGFDIYVSSLSVFKTSFTVSVNMLVWLADIHMIWPLGTPEHSFFTRFPVRTNGFHLFFGRTCRVELVRIGGIQKGLVSWWKGRRRNACIR